MARVSRASNGMLGASGDLVAIEHEAGDLRPEWNHPAGEETIGVVSLGEHATIRLRQEGRTGRALVWLARRSLAVLTKEARAGCAWDFPTRKDEPGSWKRGERRIHIAVQSLRRTHA